MRAELAVDLVTNQNSTPNTNQMQNHSYSTVDTITQ